MKKVEDCLEARAEATSPHPLLRWLRGAFAVPERMEAGWAASPPRGHPESVDLTAVGLASGLSCKAKPELRHVPSYATGGSWSPYPSSREASFSCYPNLSARKLLIYFNLQILVPIVCCTHSVLQIPPLPSASCVHMPRVVFRTCFLLDRATRRVPQQVESIFSRPSVMRNCSLDTCCKISRNLSGSTGLPVLDETAIGWPPDTGCALVRTPLQVWAVQSRRSWFMAHAPRVHSTNHSTSALMHCLCEYGWALDSGCRGLDGYLTRL